MKAILPPKAFLWAPLTGAAILGGTLIMLSLGLFLVDQNRKLQMNAAAETGALYVEGFLTPLAYDYLSSDHLTSEIEAGIQAIVDRVPTSTHFDALKIWDKSAALIVSSEGTEIDEDDHLYRVMTALDGQIVVEIHQEENDPDARGPIEIPFIEIYAPIRDPRSQEIVAVGEIYQDATKLLYHRKVVERAIWLAIGTSAIGLTAIVLLISANRRALMRQMQAVNRIATRNRQLQEDADAARLSASRSNEQLLNRIGAEIHDGPIQLLSLLMLKAGSGDAKPGNERVEALRDLGSRVMNELRNISADLILPELKDMSLAETLRLIVDRHQGDLGKPVTLTIGDLPEATDDALRICCYRVVQEGLSNAERHAGSENISVSATTEGKNLVIKVSDDGPAPDIPPVLRGIRSGLGLLGIRHRLASFGGALTITPNPRGGTDLVACIPFG